VKDYLFMTGGCVITHALHTQDRIEKQAIDEAVKYITHLTGVACTVAATGTLVDTVHDHIIIGRTDILAKHQQLDDSSWPTSPEEYRIKRVVDAQGAAQSFIVGADAAGVRAGVYAYLEQLGCSFHLHGDILPDPAPRLPAIDFDITRAPRFAHRGMQLWNYWYVGRDSWSYADFDAYLTQFPKLGLNIFDFPLYLYEPLFTDYRYEGQLIDGHFLAGINTDLARIGGAAFGKRKRFVSPDIPDDAPQAERSAATIALMRKVFARAKELGIKTSVDIEVASLLHSNPDLLPMLPPEDLFDDGMMLSPSSPTGKKLLRTRLEALVAAYPDCDYYGIWQPEGVTMLESQGSPHPDDVAFRAAHAHLDALSPSDLDYAHSLIMAHEIMAEIKPGAQIATGGWGAERVIAASDALLPMDIIRSTLGYYEPQLTLKTNRLQNYAQTQGPKWHITWGEVDQHMWVVQPKTQTTATILNKMEGQGIEGAMLLHWRQLFSDLDISLFAKNCWTGNDRDTGLTQWITCKFGSETVAPLRAAINELEAFNLLVCDIDSIEQSIFWVGFDCGVGGVLFGHRYVGNGAPLPEMWLNDGVRPNLTVNAEAITILKRAAEHSAKAMQLAAGAGLRRLTYLDNHIRLTLALHESHLVVARAIMAIAEAQAAGNERAGLEQALAILAETNPEAIVEEFIHCLGEEGDAPDKGELGLLLSLNVKYIGGVRRLEGRIKRELGLLPKLLAPTPETKLYVECGAHAVQRSYTMPHDSSAIWSHPRTEASDAITVADGFGITVKDGIKTGRVNPDTGCWLQQGEIGFTLSAPAGFKGRVRLYMYYEPDFDSAFCWQEVFVNGQSLGVQKDYFCRGPYWDEGVWVEADVSVGNDGAPIEVRIKARGRLDARLSAIEMIESDI
jgi:hypothetical protein